MKIKQIAVQGYKSIQGLEELDLDQCNVLIGKNGSGKSNLLSLFDLLGNTVFGSLNLQTYIETTHEAGTVFYNKLESLPNIVVELVLSNGKQELGYKCVLTSTSSNTVIFASEAIRPISDKEAGWILLGSGHTESRLLTSDLSKNYRHMFGTCRAYHLHNTSNKSPIRSKQHVNNSKYALNNNGSNIASVLYELMKRKPRYYRRIVNTIGLIVPFFDDFVLIPENGMLKLQWREKRSDMVFNTNQASDGMLRTMVIVTLLLQPPEQLPDLIILDEPELGIHSHGIDVIAGLIGGASHHNQLILATQSPDLISCFDPEEVVLTTRSRESDTTRFNRLHSQDLGHWLKETTLGELWKRNITARFSN